jgi:hypothetical protein
MTEEQFEARVEELARLAYEEIGPDSYESAEKVKEARIELLTERKRERATDDPEFRQAYAHNVAAYYVDVLDCSADYMRNSQRRRPTA